MWDILHKGHEWKATNEKMLQEGITKSLNIIKSSRLSDGEKIRQIEAILNTTIQKLK